MKNLSKEAYGEDIKGKIYWTSGNAFCTKCKFSGLEVMKRVLSLPVRYSNIDILYVSSGPIK